MKTTTEKLAEFNALKIENVSMIYNGQNNCCRCGCKGKYVSTTFMENPRSEVNDKRATTLLNKAKRLVDEGAVIEFSDNNYNIESGEKNAITIYIDELKK